MQPGHEQSRRVAQRDDRGRPGRPLGRRRPRLHPPGAGLRRQEGFTSPAPTGSARCGAIVFLTSGQGLGPLPGEIAYAAAKAAIAGLTPTISEELIDAGITVNTVNPGPVDTGYVTEADREATAAMFPQGRWGEPDDAARLITWLLTDEARWITGQVINSEGGFARWRR